MPVHTHTGQSLSHGHSQNSSPDCCASLGKTRKGLSLLRGVERDMAIISKLIYYASPHSIRFIFENCDKMQGGPKIVSSLLDGGFFKSVPTNLGVKSRAADPEPPGSFFLVPRAFHERLLQDDFLVIAYGDRPFSMSGFSEGV